MDTYRITVLIGSLRKGSFNRMLAEAIYKLAPQNLQLAEAVISDLPLYNQDDDNNQAESVKRLKSQILAADGLLFVTPEYNRSVPGVLKNAIDHASRPPEASAWKGKAAGIVGISPAATGTGMAQQHLRNILSHISVSVMCQPEAFIRKDGFFDDSGMPAGENRKMLLRWLDSYQDWIRRHAQMKDKS